MSKIAATLLAITILVGVWAFAVTQRFADYSIRTHAESINWRSLGAMPRCTLEGDQDDNL